MTQKAKNTSNGAAVSVAPTEHYGERYFQVGAAIALLVSLVVFVRTMAPSAPFWDAGEFIATSYTLGIPHSPGTPLYVLIGRVFTLLPLPFSIAGRVNFLSALAAAGAVVMMYLLVVRFLDKTMGKSKSVADTVIKVSGGLVGAFMAAFSNTFWANAVEAEVYTISIFIMGFMTWLALKWSDDPTRHSSMKYIYLLFYLSALSVGLHLGTVLAFVGIFLLILMTPQKSFSNKQFWLASAGMAIFMADATLYRHGDWTLAMMVLLSIVLIWYYMRTKSVFPAVCTALFDTIR
jgi:hypothetical protein